MAPDCGPWLSFLSLASHQRREGNEYWGDTSRRDVREANRVAMCIQWLCALATARGVRIVIENPPTSTIWRFGPLHNRLVDIAANSFSTRGGRFGWTSQKPLLIATTISSQFWGPLQSSRADAMQCLARKKEAGQQVKPLVTPVQPKRKGKVWKQGPKEDIADSAKYPPEWGIAAATVMRSLFKVRTSL